jgi:hypothetical protein
MESSSYKIGERVRFNGAVIDKKRVWKGEIVNIQYIIRPDHATELMPVDANYILGRDSGGSKNTRRNRRNKRRTNRR